MYQLQEINQMEWEMCLYLDWELNIKLSMLKEFEAMVHKDFARPRLYVSHLHPYDYFELAATSTNPFPTIAPN
jgi:hypothetical protein